MDKNYKIEISLTDEETDSHVMTCSYVDDIKKIDQYGLDGLTLMFNRAVRLMVELQAPVMLSDDEIDFTYLKTTCQELINAIMHKQSLGVALSPEMIQLTAIRTLYGEKGLKWFEDNKKI